MKEALHKTPLWFINLITIISGIITIATPIFAFVKVGFKDAPDSIYFLAAIIVLCAFIVILFFRARKYQNVSHTRMEQTSEKYHKLLHDSRNLYFDILHSHKKNTLTLEELNSSYKSRLAIMLDYLCEVMAAYTGRKISACIKLISYNDNEDAISLDNAKLVTFCRSNNSDTDRENYEKREEIFLSHNTDFLEIVSSDSDKDYFYKWDLEEYAESLQKINRRYKNSNPQWYCYYKGTIVVPIRIEFDKLYHQKKKKNSIAYHIIGFLCIDSLSKDAFTEKQERYNVNIVKSFADDLYILLNQYSHYLKTLG